MRITLLKTIAYILSLGTICLLVTSCSFPTAGLYQGLTHQSVVKKPKYIAVLLPLTGPMGSQGEAVRNGFMAAYGYVKQSEPDAPIVRVFDTSQGHITALYQQAVAEGADFVVGPLAKDQVQILSSSGQVTVPTLALNDLSGKPVPNLFGFDLSSQQEASQAALRARQEGHNRAIVIFPAGEWGQKIAEAFIQRWQATGGLVVDTVAYPAHGDLYSQLRQVLGVMPPPRHSSGGKRYQPKPRQDMDMFFMVAFPQQARQIKSILNFYNVGTVPVYATSLVYSGILNPANDSDLNGVEFSDMPWIVGPDIPQWSQMREGIQTDFPDSYRRSPRLYALGIDAYHLTYRLGFMIKNNTSETGTTGKLTLNSDHQIQRQLQWATIQEGIPVLVDSLMGKP